MDSTLFQKLNGKSVIVRDFAVRHRDGTLDIEMTCISEDRNTYSIVFENVSKLNLAEVSYPFQICGFEIEDCSSRGYQSDSRFFVNDFEDGQLSFYCEKVEIFTSQGENNENKGNEQADRAL